MTDTGELDPAQRRWPDVRDRRRLLLLLAAAGRDAIAPGGGLSDATERRRRQQEALSRAAEPVDVGEVLADASWR